MMDIVAVVIGFLVGWPAGVMYAKAQGRGLRG